MITVVNARERRVLDRVRSEVLYSGVLALVLAGTAVLAGLVVASGSVSFGSWVVESWAWLVPGFLLGGVYDFAGEAVSGLRELRRLRRDSAYLTAMVAVDAVDAAEERAEFVRLGGRDDEDEQPPAGGRS
ncbi:hypothetical protein Ae717Ps2_0370 [Pseudonocardia sp. Ae717_Ps2]|uniref:hypothetical protein n=1 Tax=Pseudonocardia sp. Ae717_Ps2 TaxID=1885573 RepID=UPI00095B9A81|nr:hypothetical protein [Pseudonocardia sp. Ae717_Ps2]OLM29477.1 hypothetical protein Ae717Ps2_0370 [Pseudonocardia sp. Ae717_Ps2]